VSVYLLQKTRTNALYLGWFLAFFIFATIFRLILINITRQYAFSYLDFGNQTEYIRNFARDESLNSLELIVIQLLSLRVFWGVTVWLPVAFKLMYDGIVSIQKFKNIEKQNLDFEIGVLKSQINPQFINGTLENIKKLSLNNPDRAAQMVLKLSNATRYTLYETDAEYVPLQKELDFIINCIDLEETRLANRANINFRLKTNQSEHLQIAPMLLFPLMERAFKCIQSNCDIDLLVEHSVLTLKVEADKLTNCQNEDIENIKKRLGYLYANKHRLQVVENEHIFKAELRIEL
jgi:two-component system, LytTR family, sensor kinase